MKLITCDHQRYELEQEIKKGKFEGCTIKSADLHKRITWILVINNVPFQRVNYGAGVYKLMPNNGKVCTICSGKGVMG